MYVPGAGTLEWGANKPAFLETDKGVIFFETLNDFRLFKPTGTPRSYALKPADLVESLHHIAPLRGFEEWGYPLPLERTQSLVRVSLPDRAVALVTTIASNAELKKELSDRMSKLMGIGVDIEYVGSQRVKIFATGENGGHRQRLFANEGTGAQQLPFILIPVALTPGNETVLLSEPEAHLHPKGQCELTRMLLTVAKKENIQFFFETHSEHVLHTILNAVARGEWSPADVALYYFAEPKNGIAEVGRREINQFGQVDGGLPDFFEQSLAELTDYLKALSKT
jgi:predicted ATPase